MNDKYKGAVDDRRYTGESADVTFNLKRCVHVGMCLKGVEAVFDKQKRPWIQADNATADKVAEVVAQCPSGALHVIRKDGAEDEQPDDENIIHVHTRGFYRIRGELEITGETIDVPDETRLTLCRCGWSRQKPFCDNNHREVGFRGPVAKTRERRDDVETGGPLRIHFYRDGPIEIEGNFEIRDQRGNTVLQGENKKTWLCRCGASAAKPFCDQAHKKIEFEAP